MQTSRLIFYMIATSAVIVLITMNVWTVPKIDAAARGLTLFDNRRTGYSFKDASEFISALSDDGKAIYLGIQKYLDTLFPILMAISLPWALWMLTTSWAKPYRYFICAVAFIGPMCDLMENASVRVMLHAGPDGLTEQMVATASRWSVTKWTLDLVAMAAFLLLLWSALLQRHKPSA